MAARDSVHVVLWGGTSADVYLDAPAGDSTRVEWVASAALRPLSDVGPTRLRNLLPITIGTSAVPAGEYRLWIVATSDGADLVLDIRRRYHRPDN